jgi:hypothetical protein
MSLEMAHKVIVPPKKNYIPQFLKQRDINSYYPPPPVRDYEFGTTEKKTGLIPYPSPHLPPLRSRAKHSHFFPPPPPSGWQKGKRAVQQVIPGGEMPADLPNTRPSMCYSGRRSLGLATKKSLILICWFATLATLCELSAASSADLVAGVADGSGTTADESRSSSMQAFQSAGLIPQILARAPKDVLQVGCPSVHQNVSWLNLYSYLAWFRQTNVPLQSEMK